MHHPFHKTKTLPAIAILALGIVALSATLSSGSILHSNDFQSAAIGLATNIAGWSSADFDTSSIITSRIDFVEASFPIATSETGNVDNRVLELNTDGGTLTNAVNLAYESVVYLDQMVNFVAHDDDPQWLTNDVSKLAVFLNQHSNLVVMHGGVGTTNTFTSVTNATLPAIEQGEWYRLTVEMDMSSATNSFGFGLNYAQPFFQVLLNGKQLANEYYGFSEPTNKQPETELVPDGGPWFLFTGAGEIDRVNTNAYTKVNAVCYQGTGMIDDIVLRSDAPSYPADAIQATYTFSAEFPDRIRTDTPTAVDVTFENDELANVGRDDVRIRIEKTGGVGNVEFASASTNFNNSGYASDLFNLPPTYSDTTTWTLTFDQADTYDITFSLVDDQDDVVAATTATFIATVDESSVSDDAELLSALGDPNVVSIILGDNVVVDGQVLITNNQTIDLNALELEAHYILVRNAEATIHNGTLVPYTNVIEWYDDGVTTTNKYFVRTDRTVTDGASTKLTLDAITLDGVIDAGHETDEITMILIGNAERDDLGMGDGGIVATDNLTIMNSSLNIAKQTDGAAYAVSTFALDTVIVDNNFNSSFRAIGMDAAFDDPITATIEGNDFSGVTSDNASHFYFVPYDSKGNMTVNGVVINADVTIETLEATIIALTDGFKTTNPVNTFGNGTIVQMWNTENGLVRRARKHGATDWGTVYDPLDAVSVGLATMIDETTLVVEGVDNVVTATVTYPETVPEALDAYMNDAWITTGVMLPAGTEITIDNPAEGVNNVLATLTTPTNGVYLSELLVLGGIDEGNTRTPITEGHAGQTFVWTITMVTPDAVDTTVSVQAVISDDDFTTEVVLAQDDTGVAYDPVETALADLIAGTTLVVATNANVMTATVTYPAEISALLEDYRTDAWITTLDMIPVGTEIEIVGDGVDVTAILPTETNAVYLSELLVLGGIDQGNTRTPITEGHAGQTFVWTLTITVTEAIDTTMTVQAVISDDAFATQVVLAEDAETLDIVPESQEIDGAPADWVEDNWPFGDYPTDFSTSFYSSLGEMWLVGQINEDVPFEIIEISFDGGNLVVKWFSAEAPLTRKDRGNLRLMSTDDLTQPIANWTQVAIIDEVNTIFDDTAAATGEGVNTFSIGQAEDDNLFYRLVVEPMAE